MDLRGRISKKEEMESKSTVMSALSKTLLIIFLLASIPYVASRQNATAVYEVTATGSFQNQRATITGRYVDAPYYALGDGPVCVPLGPGAMTYRHLANNLRS